MSGTDLARRVLSHYGLATRCPRRVPEAGLRTHCQLIARGKRGEIKYTHAHSPYSLYQQRVVMALIPPCAG
eukprot:3246461-Rhodomonas_salina.1